MLEEGIAGGWHLPLEQSPTARAMLRCGRHLQARLVLAALTRSLWQLTPPSPQAVARLFLLRELCRALLRKKLPFEPDELEAALWLSCDASSAKELGPWLLRQVEWVGATGRLHPALTRLRGLFEFVGDHPHAARVNNLLSRQEPAIEAAEPQTERPWRSLLAHARRVPRRLSKRWRKQAHRLLARVGEKAFTSRLLAWVWPRLQRLEHDEPRLLEGLVCLTGELSSPAAVDWLEGVAQWAYTRVQGHGPRAARLGHLAIEALARVGSTPAVQRLVALEAELPYPSARLQVAAALDGLGPNVRVEGIGDPEPDSPLGQRLERAHRQALEWALRSGRPVTGLHCCRLLRRLSQQLLFLGPNGLEAGLDGGLLWHPAESEATGWSLSQPFEQLERQVFTHLPEGDSPPLRQHQFAALARRRGWHYALAGRQHRAQRAELELGAARAIIEVRPANPGGPYTRDGMALKVILAAPRLEGRVLPRHLSETVRDWNLFCRVASDRLQPAMR
ncbi:MAG: hypothetical protein KC910_00140 [Candidatus Eremiobacteraeota bacterium]|nr:hypothetical protein [Candidatus Eremiobacteraeota bacterium]